VNFKFNLTLKIASNYIFKFVSSLVDVEYSTTKRLLFI